MTTACLRRFPVPACAKPSCWLRKRDAGACLLRSLFSKRLCRRFAGFGADRIVPEQAAALDAIVLIGGSDAAQTLARLIAQRVVQGPCLRQAVAAAARLAARLRPGTVMDLLRRDELQIRADACRCTLRSEEAIPLLRELLDDLHRDVRIAAACALGRMGRSEVRGLLLGYLREEILDELGLSVSEGGEGLGRAPRHLVRPHQRQCRVVSGNGAADREGIWRENGNSPERAGMARRLRYAPTGRRDRGEAPGPRAALTAAVAYLLERISTKLHRGRHPLANPPPIKGEGLYQHSYLYSRPLQGGGSGWG